MTAYNQEIEIIPQDFSHQFAIGNVQSAVSGIQSMTSKGGRYFPDCLEHSEWQLVVGVVPSSLSHILVWNNCLVGGRGPCLLACFQAGLEDNIMRFLQLLHRFIIGAIIPMINDHWKRVSRVGNYDGYWLDGFGEGLRTVSHLIKGWSYNLVLMGSRCRRWDPFKEFSMNTSLEVDHLWWS